jgi:hypothetical protein
MQSVQVTFVFLHGRETQAPSFNKHVQVATGQHIIYSAGSQVLSVYRAPGLMVASMEHQIFDFLCHHSH